MIGFLSLDVEIVVFSFGVVDLIFRGCCFIVVVVGFPLISSWDVALWSGISGSSCYYLESYILLEFL